MLDSKVIDMMTLTIGGQQLELIRLQSCSVYNCITTILFQ